MPAMNPQRRFVHISRRVRRYMEDSRPSRMTYGRLLLSVYDRETQFTASRAFRIFNFDLVSENFKASSPVIKSLFRYHCFSSTCRQWRILIRIIRPFITDASGYKYKEIVSQKQSRNNSRNSGAFRCLPGMAARHR